MNKTELHKRLSDLTEEKYRKFASSLLPEGTNMLGVRLPLLRNIAKEIVKKGWRDYVSSPPTECFEEIMLLGMVIGYVKTDVEEKLGLVEGYIPFIDNWSLCDSFCTGLSFTRDHMDRVWDFLQPYIDSDREFFIRFAVVMLLTYYIEDGTVDRVLEKLDAIRHEGYYVKMGVAWAVSICFVKYPDKTKAYLERCSLDDVTFNKSLQKITESLRVDKETKDRIRKMKR